MTENENTLDCIEAVKKIKAAILQSRYMAARLTNAEQLKLYFGIGAYVSANSREHKWGTRLQDFLAVADSGNLSGCRWAMTGYTDTP